MNKFEAGGAEITASTIDNERRADRRSPNTPATIPPKGPKIYLLGRRVDNAWGAAQGVGWGCLQQNFYLLGRGVDTARGVAQGVGRDCRINCCFYKESRTRLGILVDKFDSGGAEIGPTDDIQPSTIPLKTAPKGDPKVI